MSIFNVIGTIFKPVADLVDNIHTSPEEMGLIKTKLAEIEAKVAITMLDYQSKLMEANSKVAIAEQTHGNWLSKSWRPTVSLVFTGILVLMALEYIPFNNTLAMLAGGFLGVYSGFRTMEKRK